MGVRNGAEFIAGLKAHPKDVWIAGRQVGDVTSDLAFRLPVELLAGLFDQQVQPELRDIMTYQDEEVRSACRAVVLYSAFTRCLVRRRAAMQVWAEATFGLMGRSPDYLNTVLVAFVDAPEFFAQGGAKFADNVQGYYRYCRDNDLFLTHAIVNPQIDRSKSSSEQADPFIHLGVVDQTREGLVVRGAKMLATHGPTADELLVYPLPGSLRSGEEQHALAFGIPTDTPGLRFICREPFDAGMQSEWDHPLGAIRGAGRHGGVQRRARSVGAGVLARRCREGKCSLCRNQYSEPYRASDRHPRPGQMPISHRPGRCVDTDGEDGRVSPCPRAAR